MVTFRRRMNAAQLSRRWYARPRYRVRPHCLPLACLLAGVTACTHYTKPVGYGERPTGKDAYVFGFFKTQGAGEVSDPKRTMGFRFECSDKHTYTLRFSHETPLQVVRIAPGQCSLSEVVYTYSDGTNVGKQEVPEQFRAAQLFEANHLYYLGDFEATTSTDGFVQHWQLTGAHHNYADTADTVRRYYPALAVLPVEDRMPGIENRAAPLRGLTPEEIRERSAASDSMPEARD